MIETIVGKINTDRLAPLTFITRLGGVARAQVLRVGDKNKTVPVSVNPGTDACQTGDYLLLSPDSAQACIAYWELVTNEQLRRSAHLIQMRATLRLVLWAKIARFSPASMDVLAANVIGAMTPFWKMGKDGHIIDAKCEFLHEEPKTPAIFSRYTYDERERQYLMLPYDYASLLFQVHYSISGACADSITLNPDGC